MKRNVYEIAIIGGGASGLMLAANLDLGGRPGVVLEGSGSLGSKLLMSGGGHCNITHGGPVKDFLPAYGDAGRPLRRCLYRHSNLELCSWLISRGLPLTVSPRHGDSRDPDAPLAASGIEDAGRIFPASMRAADVRDLLIREARERGWKLRTGCRVSGLRRPGCPHAAYEPGAAAGSLNAGSGKGTCDCSMNAGAGGAEGWNIMLDSGEVLRARDIVTASGGITYPETGSDGSVLEIMRQMGVDISDPRSALAPVYVENYPYAELSGISLPGVTVSVPGAAGRGKAVRMTGEILFTHSGFSGPVILDISKYVRPGSRITISYNREHCELPRRLQRVLESRARGGSGDIKTKKLSALLAADDFVVRSVDPRGMVTAGGVRLDEIDLSTMRLRRFSSPEGAAYVIGEAIDADGITGGYNLQLCWSTALTAADALTAAALTSAEQ